MRANVFKGMRSLANQIISKHEFLAAGVDRYLVNSMQLMGPGTLLPSTHTAGSAHENIFF